MVTVTRRRRQVCRARGGLSGVATTRARVLVLALLTGCTTTRMGWRGGRVRAAVGARAIVGSQALQPDRAARGS